MIRFCTYILLAALTLQSFYRSIMMVDYQLHLPEYLAKCINKDKPQLFCQGQCVLMKKIRDKEKEQTKKNMVVYDYSAHYVHKERMILASFEPAFEMQRNAFFPDQMDYRFTFNNSVFRPPIV